MSRVCCICEKGQMTGYKVSHSNRKARRNWGANVQKVKLDVNGVEKTQYVCTRCLRTMRKNEG